MNSDQFENIWQTKLLPTLLPLEVERNKAKRQIVASTLMVLSMFGGFFAYEEFPGKEIYIGLIIFLFVVIGAIVRYKNKNTFHKQYKTSVISSLIQSLTQKWNIFLREQDRESFEANRLTLVNEFKNSHLCIAYEDLSTDEILSSNSTGVSILGAEMSATRTENNGKRTETIYMFTGLFFMITLDRPFEGETYFLTEGDKRDRDSGYIFGGTNVPITELEWVDFEKVFKIESTNPREAREIFTPDFMAVIHDWWTEYKRSIRIGFKGNHIYLAIPSDALFEPRIFGSLDNEKSSLKYSYDSMTLVENLTSVLLYHQRLKINSRESEVFKVV